MNTVLIYRDGEAVPAIRVTARPYVSRLWVKAALLLSNMLMLLDAHGEVSSSASFDKNTLQQRGIDPALATLLLAAPRFTAGKHPVTLTVNGQRHGRVDVTFNRDGGLCFDRALLDAANLSVPARTLDDIRCHDFLGTWPQALIEADPTSLGLSLIVPTDAIRPVTRDFSGYQTGGIAGLLNYDVTGLQSRYGDQSSRYASANTELGFNAGDWIVRSRQVQTWQDDVSRTTHLAAYAQRTFASQQAVLQAGQINLYNPVLAGAQITGVQVMTEQALQVEGQSAAIEGIAHSQAQVEVRQNGALIHSTVVPAGPFSLNNVRRLNSRSDVEVTVKEADGSERRFTVPAAMLGIGLSAPGYSLAAGQVRSIGDAQDSAPWVISGGWSGALNPQALLSAGLTGAADYRAAGASLGLLPWPDTQAQATLQGAQASRNEHTRGLQADLTLSQRLNEQWSLNAGSSYRTFGYRELEDAVFDAKSDSSKSRYRDQQSAAVSWSHPWLGAFSSGMSRSTAFDGQSSSRALASWGTSIGNVSVSATAEWQVSGTNRSDDSLYLNVSIPLGESRRARTWVRSSGGEYRSGVGLSEQINDQLSYRVGVEHDTRDKQVQSSAGVSLLPRYSQLDLNYTRSDAERSSYQASARGAAVLHSGGLTLSPYPVRDTFALLSVGDMGAIKVSTPSGPVWTDWQGQAVVSQVAAYGRSPVEVDTRSLPRNADINNGLAVISAGRGAVDKIEFGITMTRRALLKVTTGNGVPLPRGATVNTEDGEFVTLVQDGGLVFLPNVLDPRALWITAPGLDRCELRFELPARADTEAYYETTAAKCRAL
ncbi:fimbria/pilus outer membrane usher protein [Pseudomonas sp. H3(2019)]|uniref:fimbria/pilus outer membrane usher protein n=1 Tax=Pseudomonas sp. H3(2019) TaxID=2598724 RepID=UPI0011958FC6|nr:fimbria/pilus outer membrane usher protein [Pseudomonas sp. H3(2019)]TVT81290.1 fimbria/pilus outer membrane usher protein [Pseudomonas sp. H3(2019)]